MVLVPLLIYLAKLEDKQAFSSAISIILPFCVVSIFFYGASGNLPLREAVPYLIGGAGGGLLGGILFRKVSARLLHLALGVLILFGGVRLIVC